MIYTPGWYSESDVQALTIVRAASIGVRLMRNNSGMFLNPAGQPVRFGLGNTSKKVNEVFKTPDLVGLCPEGYFIGCECKQTGWKFTGNKRETAQLNALKIFNKSNGFGAFISDPEIFIPLYRFFISGKRYVQSIQQSHKLVHT